MEPTLRLDYAWLPQDDAAPVTCCICSGTNPTETVFSFSLNGVTFTIRRCVKDDLMFLDPQPGERYAERLYNDPSYFSGSDDMYGMAVTPEKGKEVGELRAQELRERGGIPPAFLEIGCGHGYTLETLANAGAAVWGVDFSSAAVEECRKRGLPVSLATIKNPIPSDIQKQRPFEAIAMYSVLEHVPNPRAFLENLRGLLAPSGRLVVRVPEMSSEGPWLSLLDHLWHFTPRALESLLRQTGFEQVDRFPSGSFAGHIHGGTLKSMTVFAKPI